MSFVKILQAKLVYINQHNKMLKPCERKKKLCVGSFKKFNVHTKYIYMFQNIKTIKLS